MKNLLITSSVLLLFGVSSCKDSSKETKDEMMPSDSIAAATHEEKTAEAAPPDSAAMAKAWADYMTPGDMHRWLAAADGKWTAEVRSCQYPGGPLGEPSMASVEN